MGDRDRGREYDGDGGRDGRRGQVNQLLVELDRSMTDQQRWQVRAATIEMYDDHGLPV